MVKRYVNWLHTQWPAGLVEKMPQADDDGRTNVPGVYIVGDLTGVPLLKFSADTGARAVKHIAGDQTFQSRTTRDDVYDIAIIGGGVAGFAAAIEAEAQGLRTVIFEAAEPFSTIVNFPKAKPIYTYPTDMTPAGDLQFHDKSDVKEGLLEDLREQTIEKGIVPLSARVEEVVRKSGLLEIHLAGSDAGVDGGEDAGAEVVEAHRVIVAIGRSGNYRKLGVDGEDLPKVYNRLHDPKDYRDSKALVVGGGDSAMETAIALAEAGAAVTLSYRKPEFSRPKQENVAKLYALAKRGGGNSESQPGSVTLMMASKVSAIREDAVDVVDKDGQSQTLANDVVFAMIGREPPLSFFRRSGVRIRGEWSVGAWVGLVAFLLFCLWIYHWKATYNIPFGLGKAFSESFLAINPAAMWKWIAEHTGTYFTTEGTLGHALKISASSASFYYTLAYSSCVVIFGVRRIRRRKTPYVKWQTLTLMSIQVLPLFLLPEIFLPWAGHNGWFDAGFGKWFADLFFPAVSYGHGREYWRAYGFILAWPLMVWNWFTSDPLWGWLIVGSLQTFVAIPAMIYFWGKGSYCGWICSCGALAETMGDQHRQKMPHGPFWNRLNMVGQVFLLFAVVLMGLRIVAWSTAPDEKPRRAATRAAYYDADADVTRTSLRGVTTERLQGATQLRIEGLPAPLEIVDIAETRGSNRATGVALKGDAGDIGNQNATVVWDPPTKVYRASSAVFEYMAKGNGLPIFNYAYLVDLIVAGVLGVGLYFHFSGRVWCRFACPLAALMHIYARFSRFRILADKKKCISCNVCTTVCHQGIDVMNFANKGLGMEDPECVRCSACVQSCPTGVLSFGQVDRKTGATISQDPAWLAASPVRMAEVTVNGQAISAEPPVGVV